MTKLFTRTGPALFLGLAVAISTMGMAAFRTPLVETVVTGDHRSAEEKARDVWRHPAETLEFFGMEPDMTVAEVWPGGRGWYLKIIAPTLAQGGGTYYAITPWDPASDNERVQAALTKFKADFLDKPETYGAINTTLMRRDQGNIAPDGSLDMVLTFRNVHNWLTGDPATDYSDEYMAAFFKALKPGGVLGVVEHRANPTADVDPAAGNGYVHEAQVLAMAERAGFEFVARGDMNANPADTKDHPFGVWTLPPTKRTAGRGQPPNPDFDRTKYDAIGESDRMTLKFRKPMPAAN